MPLHERLFAIARSSRSYQFDSPRTKLAWELAQAVTKLGKDFPPEGEDLQTEPITFEPEHKERGTYAIFLAGTVIGTGHEDVFVVPHRSVKILKRLNIPYHTAVLSSK